LPASLAYVPIVTRSDSGGWTIDHEALTRVRSDLLLLDSSVAADFSDELNVEVMESGSLKQLLGSVLKLGHRIGAGRSAMQRIANFEARLKEIRDRVGLSNQTPPEKMPTAVCITRLQPLTVGGRWIPDLVDLAGGRPLLAASGEPSREVVWDEIFEADPDIIALMVEGLRMDVVLEEARRLTFQEGWKSLPAVGRGRVVVLDGGRYFNRPSPRLYRSIELLVATFYPEVVQAES
jgi:iron complex transport system substrate-binding protein